jgi:chromatin modification-related protein VID21
MRIDFREERKWKLALAYNLSTAVLEWHFAKTPEERQRAGICVKWKPSQFINDDSKLPSDDAMQVDVVPIHDEQPIQTEQADATHIKSTLLGVNYGSDDEDEDEQEKDQQSVINALEPASLIEDALNDVDEVHPKDEEVDDQSAINLLRQIPETSDAMDTNGAESNQTQVIDGFKGLKTTSSDPILGGSKSSSQSTNGDADPPMVSTKPTQSELAPLRERIVYSTDDQLFMDIKSISDDPSTVLEGKAEPDSLISDLSKLFPDLQPLGMLDVAPPLPDGKKKAEKKSDRDDPNKRIEDTTYTKLYPTGRFMYSKPTLIGPLQPSKRFKDGKWLPIDQVSIVPDLETTIKFTEENTSGGSSRKCRMLIF